MITQGGGKLPWTDSNENFTQKCFQLKIVFVKWVFWSLKREESIKDISKPLRTLLHEEVTLQRWYCWTQDGGQFSMDEMRLEEMSWMRLVYFQTSWDELRWDELRWVEMRLAEMSRDEMRRLVKMIMNYEDCQQCPWAFFGMEGRMGWLRPH